MGRSPPSPGRRLSRLLGHVLRRDSAGAHLPLRPRGCASSSIKRDDGAEKTISLLRKELEEAQKKMEKQEAELAQLRQASGVVVQDDHEGLPPKALPRLDGRKVGAEEIAAALHESGAVVVERLVDPKLMDQVSAELEDKQKFFGEKGSFVGHHTTRNPVKSLGESASLRQLAVNEKIVGAVETLLLPHCKKINLCTCSALTQLPPEPGEPPAPAQPLHRDDGLWQVSTWTQLMPPEQRPHLSVSIMWAVSNFTEKNGSTHVICGSHRWDRDRELRREDVEIASMPKGSCLLWVGAAAHSAGGCTADRTVERQRREGVLFLYNQGWLQREQNFQFGIPLKVQREFHPKLQDMLGLTGTNAMDHDWFSGPVYTQPYMGGPAKPGQATELFQKGYLSDGDNKKHRKSED